MTDRKAFIIALLLIILAGFMMPLGGCTVNHGCIEAGGSCEELSR